MDDESAIAARRRFNSPAGSPEALAKAAKGRETKARRKAEELGRLQETECHAEPAGRKRAKAVPVLADTNRHWTPEKQMMFLAALGETGRVDEAVRAAGMKFTSLYSLRARDEAFAAAWAQAMECHGELAEAIVLDHAINGYEPAQPGEDGGKRVKSERLMIEVLRTRRARALAMSQGANDETGALPPGKAGERARLKFEAAMDAIAAKIAATK